METFSYCSRNVHNSGAENEFRHRFHHIVQIHLVSPFLFDVNYQSEHVQRWMEEAHLLPMDSHDSEEQIEVIKTRVNLCVSVYTALIKKFRGEPIVSSNNEMVANSLKWLNKCRPTLDQLLLKTKSDWLWMHEICEEVNVGNEKEVLALILTSLHIMMTKDKIVENYDRTCTESFEECNWFKNDGNTRLHNNYFNEAIESFSHGLMIHPFCCEMYVSRAQAYIEVKEYKLAELDAIRAVFLKCDLTTGYKFLLIALVKQGCIDKANSVCKEALAKCAFVGNEDTGSDFKTLTDICRDINKKAEISVCTVKTEVLDTKKDCDLSSESSEEESESDNEIATDDKPINNQIEAKKPKEVMLIVDPEEENEENETETTEIINTTETESPIKFKKVNLSSSEDLKRDENVFIKHKLWQTMVFEASTNLVNQHYKLASQLYSEALKFMRENPIQEFIKEKEIVLIKYAYGMSCVETRSREEMLNSIVVFEEILNKHSHVMFPLVYYGLTYSYFKQNRFKEALQIAKTGLDTCKNMMISLLTWPQIDNNIPESATGKFKVKLEKLIEFCLSPPPPDAVCRYSKCNGHFKNEIYLTDPDCKGFVKVICDEECALQYHYNCWKSIKDEIKIFNDKEFLDTTCLTPDCPGGLMELVHINSKGENAKRFISEAWKKGGGSKQKRPRHEFQLGKKSHKEKKRKKYDETLKDDSFKPEQEEDEQSPEYETFESIAATIFDLKPTPQTKSPVKMPVFPPENVTLTVLKKVDELEETVLDIKARKRRRKKKQNNQLAEIETASRHSSESDHTSSISREMVEDELAAMSRESIVNETIKKTLLECMKLFLKETGKVRNDDVRVIAELAKLPIEVQEYIADIGGIHEFLKKSDDFVVYDNIICLTEHFTGVFTPVDPPRSKSASDHWSMLDTITECSEPHETTSTSSEFEWLDPRKNKAKSQMNCSISTNTRTLNENDGVKPAKPNMLYWLPTNPMDEMSNVSAEDLNMDNVTEAMMRERNSGFKPSENQAGNVEFERKALENAELRRRPVEGGEFRRDSEMEACSPSSGQGAGQFFTNLQKLWKFVSKFSDKGQGKMLKLVLELIIKERILERFSPNPENVGRAKQTFMFAIDALSDSAECECQTEENEELKKQVKEHEDLIAYLLNTKRQKWEEEKKELEKKVEALTINLRDSEEAKHDLELVNLRRFAEGEERKEKALPPPQIAIPELHNYPTMSRSEIRCSSAPNASRSRDQNLKLPPQSSPVQNPTLPTAKSATSTLRKLPPPSQQQTVQTTQGFPKNSFERLMIALQSSFPNVDQNELKECVQQLRSHCANNRLSGMTIDEIIKQVSYMIRLKASRKAALGQPTPLLGGMGLERITKPGNPWSTVNTTMSNWTNPDEDEEPCVICHEDFKEFDKLCTLQCHHRFHESCIKAWFKQESTCPTCRAHSNFDFLFFFIFLLIGDTNAANGEHTQRNASKTRTAFACRVPRTTASLTFFLE
uniref:RING-type domain-containing protein n=1 Tax=Strigamia maritima TaxID=126957 RepID=T1IWL2_STRMM